MIDSMTEDQIIQHLIQTALVNGKTRLGFIMHSEVVVPEYLYKEPMITLDLSHRFADVDMKFGPESFSATLTFKGERFRCILPYRCVFMIHQGDDVIMFKERVDPKDLPAIRKSGAHIFSLESKGSDMKPEAPEPTVKDRMAARGFRVIEGGSNDVQ